MEECKQCKLALYCYSESSTWVFRTKQEMDEKLAEMEECPLHEQVKRMKASQQPVSCTSSAT